MTGFYMMGEFLLGLGLTAQMVAEMTIKKQINDFLDSHKGELELITSLNQVVQKTFVSTSLSDEFKQLNIMSAKIYQQIASNMNTAAQQIKLISQRFGKVLENKKSTSWNEQAIAGILPALTLGIFTQYMIQQAGLNYQGFKNPKTQLGRALKIGMKEQILNKARLSVGDEQIQLRTKAEALQEVPQAFTFKQLTEDGWSYFKSNKMKVIGQGFMKALRLTMFVFGAISFINGISSLQELIDLRDRLVNQLGVGKKIQVDELYISQVVSLMFVEASNLMIEGYSLVQDFHNSYNFMLILLPIYHNKIKADAEKMRPQQYVPGFNSKFIQDLSNTALTSYSKYELTKKAYQAANDPNEKRNILLKNLTQLKADIDKIKIQYSQINSALTKKFQQDSLFLNYSLQTLGSQMSYHRAFIGQMIRAFTLRPKYFLSQKQKNPTATDVDDYQVVDATLIQSIIRPSYIRNYYNPQFPQKQQIQPTFIKYDIDQILEKLQAKDPYYKQNIALFVSSFTNSFYYDDKNGKSLFNFPIDNKDGPTKQQLVKAYKTIMFPGTVPISQALYKQEVANAQIQGSMLSIKQFLAVLYKLDNRYDQEKQTRTFDILTKIRCNRIESTQGPAIVQRTVVEGGNINEVNTSTRILLFQRSMIIQVQNKILNDERDAKMKADPTFKTPRPLPQIQILTDKGKTGTPKWVLQDNKQKSKVYQYSYECGNAKRYMLSTKDFTDPKYTSLGVAFSTPKIKESQQIDIYCLKSPILNIGEKYIYSTSNLSSKDGWSYVDLAFYAYQKQAEKSVPIYRYHLQDAYGWSFYYSQVQQAPQAGWTLDGIFFHAYP